MAADWLDREMEIWHNLAHLAEDAIEDIMIQDAQEQLRQNEIMGHYLYAENEHYQRWQEEEYANAVNNETKQEISDRSLERADMAKEAQKSVVNNNEDWFTNDVVDLDFNAIAELQEDIERRHNNPNNNYTHLNPDDFDFLG